MVSMENYPFYRFGAVITGAYNASGGTGNVVSEYGN